MLDRIVENYSMIGCAAVAWTFIEEKMNLEDAIEALRAELVILDRAIEALEVLASAKAKSKGNLTTMTSARKSHIIRLPRSPRAQIDAGEPPAS